MYYPRVRMPWTKRDEPTALTLSIADPLLAGYFNPGGVNLSGVNVGERDALGLSSLYRAVNLIAGTLASLPFRSYREGSGGREVVPSVFDDPDGPDGQTLYEWKESLFLHLLLHARAGALKVRNEAGSVVRLPLVHPYGFQVCQPSIEEYASGNLPAGGVWFDVNMGDGSRKRYDSEDFWYVPGLSLAGQEGLSLLALARQSLGTTVAADRSAAKVFNSGALISGIVSPQDDTEPFEATEIKRQLDQNVSGYEHAGGIAVINRRLNFQPWTMTAKDAQFLEGRQFQIEEVSRWTGVPPHLLMQTDKQTSWGTGVDEQNRGLSKFVLGHWANRVEQRASRLLARPRWAEFDFAGLERPNFATEVDLLVKQVQAGLLTVNEARAIRNLPPLPETPDPAPADAGEGDQ
jgi:HK97 family phage portal protein